ncbi:MAG: hypothetical protein KGL78_07785 [Burkholderiales bacterium]|nr:hypothetical protein [Burkholderiales bacterium]
MAARRRRTAAGAAVKAGELALAAPQVVAHRLARMALAGPVLSARDRQEFTGMVLEKQRAFVESWAAMSAEAMKLAASPWTAWWTPARLQSAALRIADRGLAPVHGKAVANAKRLRRTRLK